MEEFDVVFIGGGPGGYTGSIRSAQLGLKTAIIEKNSTLGGTCLNVGCIPSKALLDSSEHYSMAKHEFAEHGIDVPNVELNLPKMLKRKEKIVKDLTQGIAFLMKKNKIKHFTGEGSLIDATTIEVKTAEGPLKIKAKNIVLATGSTPVQLPFAKFDGDKIVSSTEALSFTSVPKHLIVIGGGVIGSELGSVWLRLGSEVSVIEGNANICGSMDAQMTQALQKSLVKQGMQFHMQSRVSKVQVNGSQVEVTFTKDGKETTLSGDKCLLAVGRKPYSDNLGLENVGVAKDDKGRVLVDKNLRTNVASIYAIGDLIPGWMLAHKAEEEGVAVAEFIATGHGHVNYETVPGVVYTWPELASVGATEEELKAKGVQYKAGSFPFMANGRAKALGFTEGSVKILADSKTDRVLGVHVLGPRASDVIAEAVIAMEFGASSEDIARSFHGHPTLSEVMREAALAVDKRARQM